MRSDRGRSASLPGLSMPSKTTGPARQRRYLDRMRERGLVPITVLVPTDRLGEFQQAAAQARADHAQQSEADRD